MNILVIGAAQRYEALQRKGGLDAHIVQWKETLSGVDTLTPYQLVIDLELDEHPLEATIYAKFPSVPVLAGMVKTSLGAVMNNVAFSYGFNLIGCNWLPGFIDMQVTEVSVMDQEQQPLLHELMQALGWQFEVVQDGVGMVTPRVICMIINEAYMAAEEGTASKEDINTAMRLGTNYPSGPFEWCGKIGVKNVYDVLQALYDTTGNERYKVSALLQQEAGIAR